MWKTGHSLIKSKMKETGAPLAGEMSGHIFFKHRWYGFDDALYAAVRLIEAVSAQRQEPDRDHGRDAQVGRHARAALPGRRGAQVRDRRRSPRPACRRTAPRSMRPTASGSAPSDGWWLLRASNTQDVLVARAEATDQAGLDRLVAQIDDQLGSESGVHSVRRRALIATLDLRSIGSAVEPLMAEPARSASFARTG